MPRGVEIHAVESAPVNQPLDRSPTSGVSWTFLLLSRFSKVRTVVGLFVGPHGKVGCDIRTRGTVSMRKCGCQREPGEPWKESRALLSTVRCRSASVGREDLSVSGSRGFRGTTCLNESSASACVGRG